MVSPNDHTPADVRSPPSPTGQNRPMPPPERASASFVSLSARRSRAKSKPHEWKTRVVDAPSSTAGSGFLDWFHISAMFGVVNNVSRNKVALLARVAYLRADRTERTKRRAFSVQPRRHFGSTKASWRKGRIAAKALSKHPRHQEGVSIADSIQEALSGGRRST